MSLILTEPKFDPKPATPGDAALVLCYHVTRWRAGAPYDQATDTEVSAAMEVLGYPG